MTGDTFLTVTAASFACTKKVYEPLARPLYVFGLAQAVQALLSSLHSNVRSLDEVILSVPVNVKVAELQ